MVVETTDGQASWHRNPVGSSVVVFACCTVCVDPRYLDNACIHLFNKEDQPSHSISVILPQTPSFLYIVASDEETVILK